MRVDNNSTIELEIMQNINKKMRYSTGFSMIKKALSLAISLNCDDELMGILHQFIEDKQKLNTNCSSNCTKNEETIQVTDPFVIQKRGASSKRLKSSAECVNNTANKCKKRVLAPLDGNLQLKKI